MERTIMKDPVFLAQKSAPATAEDLPVAQDLLDTLGDRDVALCRELTKLHEEVVRTTLSGAVARFTETPPRGEFVLVLRGAPETDAPEMTEDDALAAVARYRAEGKPLKEACRLAAADSGYAKNDLYRRCLEAGKQKE